VETLHHAGPLLTGLLEAQRREEEIVGHRLIGAVADAVIRCATDLGDCLIWPVGSAAERVAGAVTAVGEGAVKVGAWNAPVQGCRLLLVQVAAVSPLELESAADQLRMRGALEVHACGVDVRDSHVAVGLDSYERLTLARPRRSVAVVGDAA
jgi:hypothetical protein